MPHFKFQIDCVSQYHSLIQTACGTKTNWSCDRAVKIATCIHKLVRSQNPVVQKWKVSMKSKVVVLVSRTSKLFFSMVWTNSNGTNLWDESAKRSASFMELIWASQAPMDFSEWMCKSINGTNWWQRKYFCCFYNKSAKTVVQLHWEADCKFDQHPYLNTYWEFPWFKMGKETRQQDVVMLWVNSDSSQLADELLEHQSWWVFRKYGLLELC